MTVAADLDVAGRLAQAAAAVENTQQFVWACRQVGYDHPDLTGHRTQIQEWFASEAGMDLRALDADCASLRAVAEATDDAVAQQRGQWARLRTAWIGDGGLAAAELVGRHCYAAESLAAAIREAATTLAALRDNLWRIVDGKATVVTAIDDRRQAERQTWLAAAQSITTGLGDRAAASELVDQQVKPFVDNDIRVDWLEAVRATMTAIARSYEAAIANLTAIAPVQFDLPEDPGPTADSRADLRFPTAAVVPPETAPAGNAPAWPAPSAPSVGVGYPAAAGAPVPTAMPAPQGPPAEGALPAASVAPALPTMPAAASSTPAAGLGGLGGLGQWLADTLGSFLPSFGNGASSGSGFEAQGFDHGFGDRAHELRNPEDDTANGDGPGDEGDGTGGRGEEGSGDGQTTGDENAGDEEKNGDGQNTGGQNSGDEGDAGDAGATGATGASTNADGQDGEPLVAGSSADSSDDADCPTSDAGQPAAAHPGAVAPPVEPVGPAPAAQPVKTPCEIAADELPKVGR